MGARRNIDAGRLSALAARPGMDTRIWVSLAHVTAVGFDAKEGCFADLTLQPTGERECAYYGAPYAGGGFGDHCPLEVNDTVLVAIPGGDPGNGPIIVARFNNAGDPPHADFGAGAAPSSDRVLRVKPGQQLIIRTTDGDIVVEGEGSANLNLRAAGSGDALLEAASGDATVNAGGDASLVAGGDVAVKAPQGRGELSAALQLDVKTLAGPLNVQASAGLTLAGAGVSIGVAAPGGGPPSGPGQIGVSSRGAALGGPLATLSIALGEITDANFAALQTLLIAAFTAVGVGVAANGPAGAAVIAGFTAAPTGSSTQKAAP